MLTEAGVFACAAGAKDWPYFMKQFSAEHTKRYSSKSLAGPTGCIFGTSVGVMKNLSTRIGFHSNHDKMSYFRRFCLTLG